MSDKIKVGDFYEDCGYIPRLCIESHYDKESIYDSCLSGISLVDGSIGHCSVYHCAPRKLTKKEAIAIRTDGPNEEIKKYLIEFYAGEWGGGRKIWW